MLQKAQDRERGADGNPIGRAEIIAKFDNNVAVNLDADRGKQLLDALLHVEDWRGMGGFLDLAVIDG